MPSTFTELTSLPVVLKILGGTASCQDLLPKGSVDALPRNKVVELSLPTSGGPLVAPYVLLYTNGCKASLHLHGEYDLGKPADLIHSASVRSRGITNA
jgi:hypothetical protein